MSIRLHLIDGTYELYRAHFSGRPGHRDPKGRELKATVGLVASMISLLHDESERVTHLAIAFDNPIRSFRNELFEGYKSDDGVPPELRAQFDEVERAMRSLGVVVWSMDRFEADDALATAAARWKGEVEQIRLLTPDKDLGQCLDGRSVVQVDRKRALEIDEPHFREARGFGPRSLPDFLALVGDAADGIPGIPGFGSKSASTLLAKYAHLEAIPASAAEWSVKLRGAERLAGTLASRREDALLYRRLATLVEDVPLPEALGDLEFRGLPRRQYEAWCSEVGASSLRSRPKRWSTESERVDSPRRSGGSSQTR